MSLESAALVTYIFCKIYNDGRANSIFSFPFDGNKQWHTGDRHDTFYMDVAYVINLPDIPV
jgi:hypothetical protein